MNRLNLSAVRPIAALVRGVCATDSRIPGWVSEAQERLMCRGRWLGSATRYRFCSHSACITLPRQIETVEAWALCHSPGIIRNSWYEYAGTGGLRGESSGCGRTMIDRGTACSFADMTSAAAKINVLAAVTESASSRILLQGYDQNAQWIRTQDAGVWIDGEYVLISTAGTRTVNTFTNLTGVQKPVTNGPVTLWEWPIALGTNLNQLAYYEADETLPIYRRYQVPGLSDTGACCGQDSECEDKAVTVMAKLQHIPVFLDTDWLILGNRTAFKLELMAIAKEEKNLFDQAFQHESRALAQLEYELSSFEGDGVVPILRVDNSGIFGAGIENVISGSYV